MSGWRHNNEIGINGGGLENGFEMVENPYRREHDFGKFWDFVKRLSALLF